MYLFFAKQSLWVSFVSTFIFPVYTVKTISPNPQMMAIFDCIVENILWQLNDFKDSIQYHKAFTQLFLNGISETGPRIKSWFGALKGHMWGKKKQWNPLRGCVDLETLFLVLCCSSIPHPHFKEMHRKINADKQHFSFYVSFYIWDYPFKILWMSTIQPMQAKPKSLWDSLTSRFETNKLLCAKYVFSLNFNYKNFIREYELW